MEEKLSYAQAMDALKAGHIVALPEWGGWWFQINDLIYVFTKEGLILDTPWHDKFNTRDDWREVKLNGDNVTAFVKANRVRMDAILQKIQTTSGSREMSLAYTDGQKGFMKLGLYLGQIGAEYPYPKSYDSKSPVIEKPTDKAEVVFILPGDWDEFDHTATIKELRKLMVQSKSFIKWIHDTATASLEGSKAKEAVILFEDSNMWLGQQLNNILKQQEYEEWVAKKHEEDVTEQAKKAYGRWLTNQPDKNPAFDDLSEVKKIAYIEMIRPLVRRPDMACADGKRYKFGY